MLLPVKILIVNQFEILRIGVKQVLLDFCRLYSFEVREANTVKDGLVNFTSKEPDIVIIDLSALTIEDKVLTKTERAQISGIPIIALSDHVKARTINELSGYNLKSVLQKNVGSKELSLAVVAAIEGEEYSNPDLPGNEEYKFLTALEEQLHITKREKEIFHLIINELSSKEISRKLFLSKRTVEKHRYNLIKKLKAVNLHQTLKNISANFISKFSDN